MLYITNTVLFMHPDRLYARECSSQAPYASAQQDIFAHQTWQEALINAHHEADIIAKLNASGSAQQHSIDTYVLHVYIHELNQPPFTSLTPLIDSPLTLSFDTPGGLAYRHLYITAMRQLDHDGSFGYYRLIAQPITYRLHR